jgi:hypothetical protein
MSKAAEVVLSHKAATITVGSSFMTWIASSWQWVNSNIVELSGFASFILVLVMVVAHICTQIRENRTSKIANRKNELEIEILRRKLNDKNGE